MIGMLLVMTWREISIDIIDYVNNIMAKVDITVSLHRVISWQYQIT